MSITSDDLTKWTIFYLLGYITTKLLNTTSKRLNGERQRLIRQHIRAGHHYPLKYCLDPDCQPLRHL